MMISREAHAIVQALDELTQVLKDIRDLMPEPEEEPEEEPDDEADPDNYIL